jgi:hypothetical protein
MVGTFLAAEKGIPISTLFAARPGQTQDFSGTRTFFRARFYHAVYLITVSNNALGSIPIRGLSQTAWTGHAGYLRWT